MFSNVEQAYDIIKNDKPFRKEALDYILNNNLHYCYIILVKCDITIKERNKIFKQLNNNLDYLCQFLLSDIEKDDNEVNKILENVIKNNYLKGFSNIISRINFDEDEIEFIIQQIIENNSEKLIPPLILNIKLTNNQIERLVGMQVYNKIKESH